jgi:hypothetical protein
MTYQHVFTRNVDESVTVTRPPTTATHGACDTSFIPCARTASRARTEAFRYLGGQCDEDYVNEKQVYYVLQVAKRFYLVRPLGWHILKRRRRSSVIPGILRLEGSSAAGSGTADR